MAICAVCDAVKLNPSGKFQKRINFFTIYLLYVGPQIPQPWIEFSIRVLLSLCVD